MSGGLQLWQPPSLPPGHEWWTDNPHRLGARLRAQQLRGQVAVVSRWELTPGVHGALVRRLKPRPTRRKQIARRAGVAALVLVPLAVAGHAVAQLLGWLVAHAAVFGGALLAFGFLLCLRLNHRATCTGLHCPGCRG